MLLNTKKHRESLSAEQKGQVMTIDAAAHKKQYELLPPEKKTRRVKTRAKQCHEHLTEEEKKFLHRYGLLMLPSMKELI